MTDAQLIDMAALRSKLVAAQTECRDGGNRAYALELITDALTLLTPRLDPEARHPSVDKGVVGAAISAAHDTLIAGGISNPVEVLIVQSHDENGKTTGRTLASSAGNPQDLLRVCLENVRRSVGRQHGTEA